MDVPIFKYKINIMKKIALSIFLVLPFLAFAQQKDYIVTLQADEYLSSDYSQILGTSNGYEWKVVTEDDERHYHQYLKDAERATAEVDLRIGSFITTGTEDGLKYFKVNTTGKKYGPYEEINAYTNDKKQKLYAYQYVKDSKTYFVDLRNDKTYGPFDQGGLWHIDEENMVYSYNEGADIYLMENSKKYGPYQQVSYRVPQIADIKPLITYKKDNKFYVEAPQCKGVVFERYPLVSELRDGWLIEGSEEISVKVKWLYLPDGRKLDFSDEIKHIVNFNGKVLKAVHEAGRGSYAAYKVSYNDNELGTYCIKKNYRQGIAHTDFFNYSLMGVTINSPASSFGKQEENYFYSPSKGMVGPLTKEEARYVYFFSGGYANISKDSTLFVNGKKTLEDIVIAVFRDESNWYAFQKRGDYIYPFKNGIEVAVSDLPKEYQYFDTEDKFAIRVQRGDKFFIRVKGENKLLGPVEQFDQFVVSADGNHYAIVRGRDGLVEVDGKPLVKGYSVSYNAQLNAFQWWNTEGKKVYVYTKKL